MTNIPCIIGGGLTGLAAAWELVEQGKKCVLLEKETELGGLAAVLPTAGHPIERFYHHLFTTDQAIFKLIEEVQLADHIELHESNTAAWVDGKIYRLRKPADLLRLRIMPFMARLRTGLMVLKAKRIEDWHSLEDETAYEWICRTAGRAAADKFWMPLMRGKFGPYTDRISAVWLYNKFKLRGGSRGKGGKEYLAYLRGGFGKLIETLRQRLIERGVEIRPNCPARRIVIEQGRVAGVETDEGLIPAEQVLAAVQLPDFLKLTPELPEDLAAQCKKIEFLANTCLILELNRPLSEVYWLNICDPSFPFVGAIEHTNLESPDRYGGRHFVYLSAYITQDDWRYQVNGDELYRRYLPWIHRLWPRFDESPVVNRYLWRAPYAQPVVVRRYSELIPPTRCPVRGLFLATMAQIYPEDRGTNYAVAYGRKAARELLKKC